MKRKQFLILAAYMHQTLLKDAVMLVLVDGWSQASAAFLIGCSKQSLNNAIRRLNKRLTGYNNMDKI